MIHGPSLLFGQVGAHDFTFEACSGFTRIAARRLADPPMVGLCPESFSDSVALLAASVATGAYRQFPRQDLHLQETTAPFAVHRIIQAKPSCFGAARPDEAVAP